jgi:amino acid adenylation domain-containing protein
VSVCEKLDALGQTLESTFSTLRSAGNTPVVHYTDDFLRGDQLRSYVGWIIEELRVCGLHAQDRVVVLLDRSCHWIPPILACLTAGFVYIPIDVSAPRWRIDKQIAHIHPQAILVSASTEHLVPDGFACLSIPSDLSSVNIEFDPRPVAMRSSDLAYMMFTSGTTGTPRAAMISRGNLTNFLHMMAKYYDSSPHLTVGMLAPTHFDASWKCIAGVLFGHSLLIVPRELRIDPSLMREHIIGRVDIIDGTPYDLPSFGDASEKRFFIGGAIFGNASWLYATTLTTAFNVYGPTECTVFVAETQVLGENENIGARGVASNELRIVDSTLQTVAAGMVGELVVEGPSVGLGYWNDPAHTATRFVPSPSNHTPGARTYRTGDLAVYRNGSISIVGRVDAERKRNGHRVNLDEIADVACAHGNVKSAVVIDVSAEWPRRPFVAVYATTANEPLPGATLRTWMGTRLPHYALPDRYIQVDALPHTLAGKVDRAAVTRLVMNHTNASISRPTEDDLERISDE